MSRALVTFGIGPHRELLDIALPTFERYAGRHGYDLIVAEPGAGALDVQVMSERPASWLKVPLLRNLLGEHDEVLWLDSDVVIVDDSEDLAAHVAADRWQGLALHRSVYDGAHPNHGVWLLRPPMVPILDLIWRQTRYIDHPWWEQAASLWLLGYDVEHRPLREPTPNPLLERTKLLSSEWNFTPGCSTTRRGRFMHAAGAGGHRERIMRGWIADAHLAA